MIDEIVVTNVALIRHASFQPSSGLTVLTGETGRRQNCTALSNFAAHWPKSGCIAYT